MKKGDPFGGGFPGGKDPFGGGESAGLPDSGSDLPSDFPVGPAQTHVVTGLEGGFVAEKRGVFPQGLEAEVNPEEGALVSPPALGTEPSAPVIHLTVFARFHQEGAQQLIKDIGYLHAASGSAFHIVLPGYSRKAPAQRPDRLSDTREIALGNGIVWYYDDHAFQAQVQMIEQATKWRYRGGLQVLVCDVQVPGRTGASTTHMFREGGARLEHVLVIDMEQLKENKLFSDFDRFFNALRPNIEEIVGRGSARPTWDLSDRLGLSQGKVALKLLASALKLNWLETLDEAKVLSIFAVRDLRRSP